jgi:hypothetical protein
MQQRVLLVLAQRHTREFSSQFSSMSSVIAFINNFLLSLEGNEHSSDSNVEEHIALAPADEAAISDGMEGDGSNGQPVEEDFCHGNSN